MEFVAHLDGRYPALHARPNYPRPSHHQVVLKKSDIEEPPHLYCCDAGWRVGHSTQRDPRHLFKVGHMVGSVGLYCCDAGWRVGFSTQRDPRHLIASCCDAGRKKGERMPLARGTRDE